MNSKLFLEPAKTEDYLVYYLSIDELKRYSELENAISELLSRQNLHKYDYILAIVIGVLVGYVDQHLDKTLSYDENGERIPSKRAELLKIIGVEIPRFVELLTVENLDFNKIVSIFLGFIGIKDQNTSVFSMSKYYENISITSKEDNFKKWFETNIPNLKEEISDLLIDYTSVKAVECLVSYLADMTIYRNRRIQVNSNEHYIMKILALNAYSVVQLSYGQTNFIQSVGFAYYYLYKSISLSNSNDKLFLDLKDLLKRAHIKLMDQIKSYTDEKAYMDSLIATFKFDNELIDREGLEKLVENKNHNLIGD